MWWHTLTHRRGSEEETGEWSGLPVPFTLPQNMVYPALLPLMRKPLLPTIDWTEAPSWFKWNRPFRRKTKPVFCACAITYQTQSTLPVLLLFVFSALFFCQDSLKNFDYRCGRNADPGEVWTLRSVTRISHSDRVFVILFGECDYSVSIIFWHYC